MNTNNFFIKGPDVLKFGELLGLQRSQISESLVGEKLVALRPMERGRLYRRALFEGFFESNADIADALGEGFSEFYAYWNLAALPWAVQYAFQRPEDIELSWSALLAKAWQTEPKRLLAMARKVQNWRKAGEYLPAPAIFQVLTSS